MKRGLPKPAPADRGARIRQATASARTRSSPARGSKTPWWHQPVLWFLLLASSALINPRLKADHQRHFAITRAMVVDHAIPAAGAIGDGALSGVSLLWSPFMLTANAGVSIARSRGATVPADGSSWPYLWASAGGTALYAFLTLWMSYRLALRFAAPAAALAATLTIWLATSIPAFLYALPFTGYLASAFAATLVLYVWTTVRDGADDRSRWFIWGLAAGLALATSLLNAAFLLFVLVEWSRGLFRRGAARALVDGLVFAAGAAIIVVPALTLRHEIDGGWLWNGHFPVFHWREPALYAAAFSSERGVFLWTPVWLLALMGLVILLGRDALAGATLICVCAAFFYLGASFNWTVEQWAFTNPWLISLTACAVCGLAKLIDVITRSRGRLVWAGVSMTAGLLVLWNLGLMLQWGTGMLPGHGPAGLRQAAMNQTAVVPRAKDFVIRYLSERRALVSDPRRGRRE